MKNKIIILFFFYKLIFTQTPQIIELKESDNTDIYLQKEEIYIVKKMEKVGLSYFKISMTTSQNSIMYNFFNSTCYSLDQLPNDYQFHNIKNITEKVEGGELVYSMSLYVDPNINKYIVIKIKGLKPQGIIKVSTYFASLNLVKNIIIGIGIALAIIFFCCCICCFKLIC